MNANEIQRRSLDTAERAGRAAERVQRTVNATLADNGGDQNHLQDTHEQMRMVTDLRILQFRIAPDLRELQSRYEKADELAKMSERQGHTAFAQAARGTEHDGPAHAHAKT